MSDIPYCVPTARFFDQIIFYPYLIPNGIYPHVEKKLRPRLYYPDRFYLSFVAGRTCKDRKDKVGTLS